MDPMFSKQTRPAAKPAHPQEFSHTAQTPKLAAEPVHHVQKAARTHHTNHAHHKPPVLAITVAIIIGITLAGFTVVMYLKSNY